MTDDLPPPEPKGKTFEPLKPASTRTETAAETGPPLVVDEETSQTLAELKGEVRSLRSRNQILRAERTSIAGRKYALEVVVENLKEKLEALAELLDGMEVPSELDAALAGIREAVGEARAIAAGKADALEADLESERTAQLRRYQEMETKVSDMSERTAGLQAERDTLREQATRLERELVHARGTIAELERFRVDAELTLEEAVEEEEEKGRRIKDLEAQVARLYQEVEELETLPSKNAEAESAVEALRQDNETQRFNLAQAEERLREALDTVEELQQAQARVQQLEAELDQSQGSLQAFQSERDQAQADLAQAMRQIDAAQEDSQRIEVERDAALAAVEEAANNLEKQEATLAELREALSEIKPVLDELDSENRRLARLVGEARNRGRVNVDELLAREKLLRKLERLSKG